MDLIKDMVEVELRDSDDFLKVRETLTRIGVSSRRNKTLFQSCHILHKQGKYYIVHFKELFALDGKQSDFSEEDKGRRNTIAQLLEDWGLVSIITKQIVNEVTVPMTKVKIIPYNQKQEWELVAKYNIGKKK